MITSIKVKNFKKFKDFELELDADLTLLVGPNNGGKTTALQAISLWAGLINLWDEKKGKASKSKATQRYGATVTRNELNLVPVREMKYLWHKTLTQGDKSSRYTILLEAEGIDTKGEKWEYGIEATYTGPHTLSCKPTLINKSIPHEARNVFHLPPLSGVQTQERKLEYGAQKTIVSEGRPGEILRNLLWEVQNQKKWPSLVHITKELFNVDLARIRFNPSSDAYIYVDYELPRESHVRSVLEIATAGSGFLQFLLISSVLFNNPNAILLLDEPDSHMHSLLQRGMYDWIKQHAQLNNVQLVVSTHSEVLINSTQIDKIKGVFDSKASTFPAGRDIISALQKLKPLDLLNASLKKRIFFAEGDTDLRIIRAWARILSHPVEAKISDVFFIPTGSDSIDEARHKFNALQPVEPKLRAIYLRDRDAHTDPSKLPSGFEQYNWHRYEIENYLLIPALLTRFVMKKGIGNLFAQSEQSKAEKYLQDNLPPAYYKAPLSTDFDIKGSKFLEDFFKAVGTRTTKGEFWQIAELMEPEDFHPDIKKFLDKLNGVI